MNFLMPRSSNQTAAHEQSVKETRVEPNYVPKTSTTLEGLITKDPIPESISSETHDEFRGENGIMGVSSETSHSEADSHIDVTEEDGLIVIPHRLPNNWVEAPDAHSFRSLDRSFVFPGEQIQILSCLSAYKHDTEMITPFKVAAVMNKNGIRQSPKKQNEDIGGETSPVSHTVDTSTVDQDNQNSESKMKGKIDSPKDVLTGESLFRMEDHRRQTEKLLQRFECSHFFARIAESDELLPLEAHPESSESFEENMTGNSSETADTPNIAAKRNRTCAAIDRGKFDARTSGGVARGAVKCCSLANGDIVVLLQVNIGVEYVRDPVLEILQFEKYQERNLALDTQHTLTSINQDPSAELLKWLLPLDNSIPPPARALSPPTLSSSSSIPAMTAKPTVSGTSGSQLFSFGNFRSYSMSSLPPNTTPPPSIGTPIAKPSFDPEDWSQFSFTKFIESGKRENGGLLSFRGVPLEPERFSVRCGLEGIFTPGRRWRKKLELIQPVEIRSFSVDCNTDDLLCVHVKNISPAHIPDIVVFIDAITIIFEEASKGGTPLSLPIACIEAGNGHNLPNLALRSGEEHSFILKLATMPLNHSKGHSDGKSRPSRLPSRSAASSGHQYSFEGKHSGDPSGRYAVLVSCRCNYTESKLFFKQPTSWRPRVSRDLMISVASDMSRINRGSVGEQLPVQVLTLQASNMTSEDLRLTVLAPASFISPSVVSLSSSPTSPLSPFADSADLVEGVVSDRQGTGVSGLSSTSLDQGRKFENDQRSVSVKEGHAPLSDFTNHDLGCTHLWLQSRVPLGCVPSQSTATIKLEVLPLTDGIISLDSLQINVKEKGLTYIPEHSLKIHATSSIATSVI